MSYLLCNGVVLKGGTGNGEMRNNLQGPHKVQYGLLSDEDSVIWRAKFEDSGTRQFRNSKHLSELMSFRSKALAYECA